MPCVMLLMESRQRGERGQVKEEEKGEREGGVACVWAKSRSCVGAA